MILEKTNRTTLALLLMSLGWINYVIFDFKGFCFLIIMLGVVLFSSCDHIYYKKKKNEVQLQIKGIKHIIKNVNEIQIQGNKLILKTDDGEEKSFDLNNFSQQDLTKLFS